MPLLRTQKRRRLIDAVWFRLNTPTIPLLRYHNTIFHLLNHRGEWAVSADVLDSYEHTGTNRRGSRRGQTSAVTLVATTG
jgi:hypothetical protein